MSAGTSYDIGAPTIEVRTYRNSQLLVRELAEIEEDAAGVVEPWSDVEDVRRKLPGAGPSRSCAP